MERMYEVKYRIDVTRHTMIIWTKENDELNLRKAIKEQIHKIKETDVEKIKIISINDVTPEK